MSSFIDLTIALALSPLLSGVINRVKAFFAGRNGQSIFQLYYDLRKLLRKAAVYSSASGFVFRAGPALSLGAVICALMLIPAGGNGALLSFNGD
ncbi:MAG: NADH-quinone oxidoreductase subunit H, partial [Elusimicrobia bacterium]|nr:NADH-quinone oxidoreductase subunit H [Elusimicrobiota bacterium]